MVYRRQGESFVRVPVTIVRRGEMMASIKGAVKQGDEVAGGGLPGRADGRLEGAEVMKTAQAVSSGLTSVILLSAIISGGAWYPRRSVTKSEREERRAENEAIATTQVVPRDFELVVDGQRETGGGEVHAGDDGSCRASDLGGSEWARVKKNDPVVELDAPRMVSEVRDLDGQYQKMVQDMVRRKVQLADGVEKADLALQESQEQLGEFKESQKLEMDLKTRQQKYDEDELALMKERIKRLQAAGGGIPGSGGQIGRPEGGDQVQGVRGPERRPKDSPISSREAEIGPSG